MPTKIDEIKITRNCFICQKGLSSALTGKMRQSCSEQPENAYVFVAGNNSHLAFRTEICVCTDCFEERQKYSVRYAVCEVITAIANGQEARK